MEARSMASKKGGMRASSKGFDIYMYHSKPR